MNRRFWVESPISKLCRGSESLYKIKNEGRTGLDLCARQPIDCVVLEIDLPDMSGFEVLARLIPRVYHPEIAVIVITWLTNEFLLDLAIRNGAQAAFLKPMTSGDILDKTILKDHFDGARI